MNPLLFYNLHKQGYHQPVSVVQWLVYQTFNLRSMGLILTIFDLYPLSLVLFSA